MHSQTWTPLNVNFNYILTESPPKLKDGLAIEAYILSQGKEEAVGVWGFKEGGRQFTRRWEDQMIGKQMFAMPCKYVFLIKKLSLVIALSGTVLVSQSLHSLLPHQAPLSMEFSRQEYWSGLPFPSPGFSGTGPLYNSFRQFKER